MKYCNRCRKQIQDGHEENCWFCFRPLCVDCWETVGHCGHERAEEINEMARKAHQPTEGEPR
jgi:hypothetical protein